MKDTQTIKVLVINNEQRSNEIISALLSSSGYTVIPTTDPEKALNFLNNENFDIVITEIHIPEISGLEIIKHINENCSQTKVVVLTSDTTVHTAVEAMKLGASEYITKPLNNEKFLEIINRITLKIHKTKQNIQDFSTQYGIIGISDKMQGIFTIIKKASRTTATVLITGESGTGKELVARAIHYTSKTPNTPFIPVNCGGIPETLLESELFGYKKGSFTGADENRQGFFETAQNGTIFLDEVSEMSMPMQVKLLRVLQEKQFYPIGSRMPVQVRVRIIAATNKNLRKLVEKNIFREDLFYRLNVISIELPPLRERKTDILILTQYFLKKYSQEFEMELPHVNENVINALSRYHWPGNIRELENIIQMLMAMQDNDVIEMKDLPEYLRYSALKGISINNTLEEVEMEYIKRILNSVGGNKSRAAKILGIDRKTLWEKLKKQPEIK